jgi:hypothetical protein
MLINDALYLQFILSARLNHHEQVAQTSLNGAEMIAQLTSVATGLASNLNGRSNKAFYFHKTPGSQLIGSSVAPDYDGSNLFPIHCRIGHFVYDQYNNSSVWIDHG